jgi:hypothetical protein
MNSLLQVLLGALSEDEREVVSGDLLEANVSPMGSVLQVFGLLVRRQLIPWSEWRLWLVLAGVAIPSAVLLAQTARLFANGSAIICWMLINNTDAALLKSAGFWYGARVYGCEVARSALILFCCSWACGRFIGQQARSSRYAVGIVILFASLLVTILGLPSHAQAVLHVKDAHNWNGAVFANSFYRVWFPLIFYVITVVIPSLMGIVRTVPGRRQSKMRGLLFSCSTALVLVGLIDQKWILIEMWSWQIIPARLMNLPSLLPLASMGPACLLMIESGKRFVSRR